MKKSSLTLYSYGQHCETEGDTKVYKKEKSYPETYIYTIYKNRSTYLFEKITYHSDYASFDGRGHSHKFKKILLDSFPPLDLNQEDLRRIESEAIKPFAYRYKDSSGKTQTEDLIISHFCVLTLIYRIGNKEIRKKIPVKDITQSDTINVPQRGYFSIRENINLEYNTKLKSTMAILYIQSLAKLFEEENRFQLIK